MSLTDASGLRRKDTTKGPPLRILSLDGGGVRGYSTLVILQELMHRMFVEINGRAPKKNEIPKPCEHFDLIVGTGTGGLIALMLGRMRMSIEQIKDTYVGMTKKVFETDKTIAGIPYRSTLFKASKLEESIKDCVRAHTIFEDEGNDEMEDMSYDPIFNQRPGSANTTGRRASTSSKYSQIGMQPISSFHGPLASSRWGKPDALLYDAREHRTKTAVTAVLKGTRRSNGPVLLRSYDSRKETAFEEKCTIWQAGRATSATALAFKPIQIGQMVFLDDGAGKYNPAPVALDEVQNEWPSREIGVFVSIGTGKRPSSSPGHQWWEGFIGGAFGDLAEARRRLVAKIEECEETHLFMKNKYLTEHRVDAANYYRLNVDVGVGEFGLNEWHRLAEISTNTRRYLVGEDIQAMNIECAAKLSRIHRTNLRWKRGESGWDKDAHRMSWEPERPLPPLPIPPTVPNAIELPAEDVYAMPFALAPQTVTTVSTVYRNASIARSPGARDDDKFVVIPDEPFTFGTPQRQRHSGDTFGSLHPTRSSNESLPIRNSLEQALSPTSTGEVPPPVPPKTPMQIAPKRYPSVKAFRPFSEPMIKESPLPEPPAFINLPSPLEDRPPPINMTNKPHFGLMI